tara:strand:+ start:834 stop:1013 length:180 start_codon:yes stop_codon:yes gene_type:complete
MEYTQQQIDAVVVITGAELFINHVLGIYSDAVLVGMQLSYDADGQLTPEDIAAIKSLMP